MIKFNWMATLKKGLIAWAVVGGIQLAVLYALTVNVALGDVMSAIQANMPMAIFGIFLTILAAGFVLNWTDKQF